MRPIFRRGGVALATSVLVVSLSGVAGSPASAETAGTTTADPAATGLVFNYWVDAKTTLKKLKQTVTVPRGTFSGSIDTTTFALTGHITLPQASAPFKAAGVPLATATFKMTEVKPVSGNLDLNTTIVTATSTVTIQIVSIVPLGTKTNLVGNNCKTWKPFTVTMAGPLSSTTFTGIYTIPLLQNCGALTAALNAVVPGPGNTFSATVTPR